MNGDVRVGQVWADNDKRSQGRTIRVVAIIRGTESKARCEVITDAGGLTPRRPRLVLIRLDRFRPNSTGYRLIQEPQ